MKLVCLDIDGTLADGPVGPALPGAISAVQKIRERLPVRLVSNTTSLSHATIAAPALKAGFIESADELVTPVVVARRVLTARGDNSGTLIVNAAARADYDWFREDPAGPAVVLATEAHDLCLKDLQPAFRHLLGGAHFYALECNRYYKKNGDLVTDIGPLAAFFSYAAGCEPQVLGKPSALLFDEIARAARIGREEIVMVGDDAEFDVSKSVALGMQGVLVRTGKYRPGDESRVSPPPTAVLDSIMELPEWLGIT